MKNFSGKALFLDRSDINTDEIIPARYLTEITKEALKPHLLEDLKMDGFAIEDIQDKCVVITRENFGCGSSREHAPWAFEVNGINLVIGESYARIFKQNMFNCGMMAVELSKGDMDQIFAKFYGKETEITTDFQNKTFKINSSDENLELSFSISEFDDELVKAGGWVGYADKNY